MTSERLEALSDGVIASFIITLITYFSVKDTMYCKSNTTEDI